MPLRKPNHRSGLSVTGGLAAAVALAAPMHAAATNVNLDASCQVRDGRLAVVSVLSDDSWPTGSIITEVMARDGAIFYTATLRRPLAERVNDEGDSFPERREVIEFLPVPSATVRASGSIAGFLPGDSVAYREARLDRVLSCPEILPSPSPVPGPEQTPSRITTIPVTRIVHRRHPRPTCAALRARNAGLQWFVKLGCRITHHSSHSWSGVAA
jgi:hypothetical protein